MEEEFFEMRPRPVGIAKPRGNQIGVFRREGDLPFLRMQKAFAPRDEIQSGKGGANAIRLPRRIRVHIAVLQNSERKAVHMRQKLGVLIDLHTAPFRFSDFSIPLVQKSMFTERNIVYN